MGLLHDAVSARVTRLCDNIAAADTNPSNGINQNRDLQRPATAGSAHQQPAPVSSSPLTRR